MDKIVFRDEFIPTKEDAVRSILDYAINIYPLDEEEKQVFKRLFLFKLLGNWFIKTAKIRFNGYFRYSREKTTKKGYR